MGYTQEPSEQETIIDFENTTIHFDEAAADAQLYTSNPVWLRKMDKLVLEHPENFREMRVETYQGKPIAKDYTFPKRFISIRTKDIKLNLTDEQKRERSERMKAIRAAQKAITE